MNVTLEQLLLILGGKEVDLHLLRAENAELRKRLSEAEKKLTPKPEASPLEVVQGSADVPRPAA